ncbi:hypothetical protein [Pseudomonas sp. Marseille-QA0892]
MRGLKERLAALDPPVKHSLETRGDTVLTTLVDARNLVKVSRAFRNKQLQNEALLYAVLRDAVNELRDKANIAPLGSDEMLAEPGEGTREVEGN